MQVVNTNVASLNGQRTLGATGTVLNQAIARLSSGLRINSAKDDAAGLAISQRMTAQIRGLNQAARNANDGVSISQVAEGALGEIGNMLQRMRELGVQMANDSNTASDRLSAQKEFSQLNSEIDRIGRQTQFNGKAVLDGTFTAQQFQVGAYATQTINVSINDSRSTAIGAYTAGSNDNIGAAIARGASAGANGVAAQTITVGGPVGSAAVSITANSTAKAVSDQVNAQAGSTGVTATASTEAVISNMDSNAVGAITFTLTGRSSAAISASVATTTDLGNLADAINANAAATGVTATLSADKAAITLAQEDGYDIKIDDLNGGATSGSPSVFNVGGKGNAGAVTLEDTQYGGGVTDSTTIAGKVNYASTGAFTLTASTGTTLVGGSGASAASLSAVSTAKLDTRVNAQSAITTLDGAITFVNDLRATLGATQARFESAVSNLQSTSQNVASARSRVQDADFAQETANLSRGQILQQAGTAMLTQANALPQSVLSLLRG